MSRRHGERTVGDVAVCLHEVPEVVDDVLQGTHATCIYSDTACIDYCIDYIRAQADAPGCMRATVRPSHPTSARVFRLEASRPSITYSGGGGKDALKGRFRKGAWTVIHHAGARADAVPAEPLPCSASSPHMPPPPHMHCYSFKPSLIPRMSPNSIVP